MSRLTATLNRYHVWGTRHENIAIMHRGYEISREIGVAYPGSAELSVIKERLKAAGYTHVRYTADQGCRPISTTKVEKL